MPKWLRLTASALDRCWCGPLDICRSGEPFLMETQR